MGEIEKKDAQIAIYQKEAGLELLPSQMPLSKMHREIYLSCRNFPLIRNIDDRNIVVNTIHTLVNQVIMDKGVNMPSEEIDYLKTRVTDDIIHDFSGYTLEEVRLALHYGVRGEFGEYFGINPTTIFGWLKGFKFEMLPPVNQKVQKLLPKQEEVIPSQEETDIKIKATIYDVYFKLATTGEYDFYDIGNVCYKYLDRIGLIPYTVEEKMDFIHESRNAFGHSVVRRNSEFQKKGKDFHKIDIDRAFEMLEEKSNPTFEHQIRIGAMRLALYHFLHGCAEQDIDLMELIEQKLTEKKD